MSEMPFEGLSADPHEYARQMERMKQYLRGEFGPAANATSALSGAVADGVAAKAEGGTPTGLIIRATRKLIDQKRRAAVHERAIEKLEAQSPESTPNPADRAAASELQEHLVRAERELSEEQLAIWTLVKQNLSASEIADRLGKSEGAVKMGRKRALERLRKWLPRAYGGTGSD